MNRWRRFWGLPAEERELVLTALTLLLLVRLGLRTLGWRRVQALLQDGCNPAARTNLDRTAIERARRAARLVSAAARLAGGTCLARSIVLVHILERRGIPAELRIGARNGERGFEAHSWVEAAGAVLNEGPEVVRRYAAFDRNFALLRNNWQ